jgi:hypothetical protein
VLRLDYLLGMCVLRRYSFARSACSVPNVMQVSHILLLTNVDTASLILGL